MSRTYRGEKSRIAAEQQNPGIPVKEIARKEKGLIYRTFGGTLPVKGGLRKKKETI